MWLQAFTPIVTMVALFMAQLEAPTSRLIAAVFLIALGTAVASYGEVSFSLVGVLYMFSSESFEATRLVMTQMLLVGLKLHPSAHSHAGMWECSREGMASRGLEALFAVTGCLNMSICRCQMLLVIRKPPPDVPQWVDSTSNSAAVFQGHIIMSSNTQRGRPFLVPPHLNGPQWPDVPVSVSKQHWAPHVLQCRANVSGNSLYSLGSPACCWGAFRPILLSSKGKTLAGLQPRV